MYRIGFNRQEKEKLRGTVVSNPEFQAKIGSVLRRELEGSVGRIFWAIAKHNISNYDSYGRSCKDCEHQRSPKQCEMCYLYTRYIGKEARMRETNVYKYIKRLSEVIRDLPPLIEIRTGLPVKGLKTTSGCRVTEDGLGVSYFAIYSAGIQYPTAVRKKDLPMFKKIVDEKLEVH